MLAFSRVPNETDGNFILSRKFFPPTLFFHRINKKKSLLPFFLDNKFKRKLKVKKFSPTRLFGTPIVFGTLEFLAVLKNEL